METQQQTRLRKKKYYKLNREVILKRAQIWQKEHPEAAAVGSRNYYFEHKEAIKKKAKKYYKKNREIMLAKMHIYYMKHKKLTN